MSQPNVTLVGCGVVGRAILDAHLAAGMSCRVADNDTQLLGKLVQNLRLAAAKWQVSKVFAGPASLPTVSITSETQSDGNSFANDNEIVIESIPERLDLKSSFYRDLEESESDDCIFCSNTSTLRIGSIAKSIANPNRFCGMHFFMPVVGRDAVELICGDNTSTETRDVAAKHISNLGKQPLVVRDTPGFVVNRLLSPYLNESLLLLCQGVAPEAIEEASLLYGMPISPLELIDMIGAKTVFDAGRVYWQSFPKRMDPSPLLAGLIKSKRIGRDSGKGVYDYDYDSRSVSVSSETNSLVDRYSIAGVTASIDEVMKRLAVAMWLEAVDACREGTVKELNSLNLAMTGGLGFESETDWINWFDTLGSSAIVETIRRFGPHSKSLDASSWVVERLESQTSSQVLMDAVAEGAANASC